MLHRDTGRFKRALRRSNSNVVDDYINGVATLTSSDISITSTNVPYGLIRARVELVVKCRETDEDVYQETGDEMNPTETLVELGNDNYIKAVREWLNACLAQQHWYTQIENGKNYEISASYSLAMSGLRNQNPIVGDCFTFIFYANFSVIESGENSQEYEVWLDNNKIPYGTFEIRRVPMQETVVFAGDSNFNAKSLNTGNVLGLSIQNPAFAGNFNSIIKNYLLNGDNNAHILHVKLNDISKTFFVIFGQVDSSSQGVLNVGQTISLVETIDDYELLSFPSGFHFYRITSSDFVMPEENQTSALKTSGSFLTAVLVSVKEINAPGITEIKQG